MAERRPLVVKDGVVQEIPSGDTISTTVAPGTGGGGGLFNNLTATAAPDATNDDTESYVVGSRWIDVTNDNTYTCVDNSTGAAVWVQENGAGGGASDFVSLSDTPANFTGQALKALRVNAGEDALEYTDFPEGGAASGVVPVYGTDIILPPSGTTVSSSAAALKANFFNVFRSIKITHIDVQVSTDHAGFVFAAIVSDNSTSGTILSIQKGTYISLTTGTGASNNIALDAPLVVEDGQMVLIGIVRTDGSTSDNNGVYFSPGGIYDTAYFKTPPSDYNMRKTINTLDVDDDLSTALFFTDKWTIGFTYQPLSGALPPGGTVGQILSKVDGTNYNTEWIDAPADGGGTPLTPRYWRIFYLAGTAFGNIDGTVTAEVEMKETVGGADVLVDSMITVSGESFGGVKASLTDDNPATWWSHDQDPALGDCWIKADFGDGTGKWIAEFTHTARDSQAGQTRPHYALEYSEDDVTWTRVVEVNPGTEFANGEKRTHANLIVQPGQSIEFTQTEKDKLASVIVGQTQTELTGTTHTVDNTDLAGNVVRRLNNASAITVTVAPSLTGTEPSTWIQTGAGQVTFAPGAGVTIHSVDSNLSIAAQYGSASLIPDVDNADTFYLVGHLA